MAHHTKVFGAFVPTSILNACAVKSLQPVESMFPERRLFLRIQWVLRDIVWFPKTSVLSQVAFRVPMNLQYITKNLLHSCSLVLTTLCK